MKSPVAGMRSEIDGSVPFVGGVTMGIGASIGLFALGAILAFAVTTNQVGAVNLDVVGWILMLAGVVGLIATLVVWAPRRRRPADVVEERRVYDDRL